MSMDPSGTHRIISRQIDEWHAIVEGERAAKLVQKDRHDGPTGPSLLVRAIGARDAVLLALRRRLRGRTAI